MLWYLLIFGTLFVIAKIVVSVMNRGALQRSQKRADELLAQGRWQEAAASYKAGILEVLDSEDHLRTLVADLDKLYKTNGVEADLGKLLRCPAEIDRLHKQKGSPKERGTLIGKVHREARTFLDGLP